MPSTGGIDDRFACRERYGQAPAVNLLMQSVVGPSGRGPGLIHYEHQFSREEFESEARALGLTVIAHETGYEGTAVARTRRATA